ncbi:MMPL family transporter [Halobacillus campisalis]|uniref:MMPL family transporter n=1 Tax=Halobacillus campisalis TaxID=435909 RepID=A0ABW2K5K7_9BACI|nr:MMPL family transporter [Halobacillus campisalis]
MKKTASLIVRSYRWIIAFWLIASLALGYFALQLPSLLEGDGFRTDGEYEQVEQELTDTFDFPESTLLLLFEKGEQTDVSFVQSIEDSLSSIEELDVGASIISPLDDESMYSESSAYAALNFENEPEDQKKVIEDIQSVINEDEAILTGAPVISEDINQASQDDLKRAELIGVPVALIILVIAFGTVVASLLPLIIGGITIVIGFGLLALIGNQMDLSIFILNIAPMIGLALSIDFALLFINRYREELLFKEKSEALIITIQTAGRSILFSAICVFIGLGAMSVIQVDIFMNIAIGGTIVIIVAVLASLTFLPAVLYVAGPHLNKWRIIPVSEGSTARWKKFAYAVMKRPLVITFTALALLVIGILPVFNMNLTIPTISSLPESYDSRAAYEQIDEEFMEDSESTAYAIVQRDDGWLDQAGLEEIEQLEEILNEPEIVDSVNTIYSSSDISSSEEFYQAMENEASRTQLEPAIEPFIQEEQLMIPINLSVTANSSEAQELLSDWSSQTFDQEISFGGQPKFNEEIYTEIYEKVGYALAIILLSTFIILTIAFRSIIIPLKAIFMNIVGLMSTFGVLVWLFQGGHFGLEEADIALILPVIVFSLVFGLSMDYEVFLISRIQEYYLQSKDNTQATADGLASTSKIITSAALIMIVITGAFAFTGVVPVKQIGIGIAVAIFIDATIIRLLLVPSLMKLLGDWNWWLPFKKAPKQQKQRS